ncbi:MAG: hypothetical protein CME62_13175 [Halobacteriovoraceae bacterium]|nr:hypothetical protein [Halobacteriovoraceae bacterium]|tara:strand:+ start:3995 stop:5458 length:1464 start_codon:yes stop_codon:yes gene_type:complete
MYVQKFEGESLDEALQMVKRELGPDAIILKTLTNKGLKGAFKKSRVEITAAISEQNYTKKAKVDHVLNEDQRQKFYQAPSTTINHMIDNYSTNTQPKEETSGPGHGGYGNMGLNKVVNTVSKASHKLMSSLDDFLAVEEEQAQHTSKRNFDEFMEKPTAQRTESPRRPVEAVEDNHHEERAEIESKLRNANELSHELQNQVKTQSHQIELLEQKLYELTQKVSGSPAHSEPRGILSLRNSLRALSLKEAIIVEIIKKASFEFTREELDDADMLYDFALREINEQINVDMPLFSRVQEEGAPVITVLVSETSCGQASMATKLSVIQDDIKMIQFRDTTSDYKSDFTKTMFNMDVSVVATLAHLMSEIRKATTEKRSVVVDLRLNFSQVDETKKFIETLRRSFDNVEILTTISAIHAEVYNSKILSKYDQFSNGVIISYVDQCLNFGSLVNLSYEFKKQPLKFFGTGPVVPDDVEAATSERILAGLFQL